MMKASLVPELRFLEFKSPWKEKKMGKVFLNSREKGNNSLTIFSVSQEYGLVPRETIKRNIQKDADAKSNLSVNSGDLVYNMMRMWQGAIGLASSQCMVSPAYVVLRPLVNEDSMFYSLLFSRNSSLHLFWAYSYGLTNDRLRLYFKDFANIKRYVPQFEEQQKIATFLTRIDQRIQLLQQKKTQLQAYKKGIMQKLFSQQIRFTDENGKGFPDWEEKRLGEVCEKKASNISANTLTNNNGDYRIYGATGFLQFVDFFREEKPYISIVKDGAGVGRILLCEAKSSVLGTLDILKPKKDNDIGFLYALISTIPFTKYITGSTIPHIYFKDYSKEKFDIPSIGEQQKIATFLSAIDESIEKVEAQIQHSQQFKKGLLQKMFV